ncbi:MAG TPA: hypothetical protein VNV15_00975 [Opitutaceae bacterium]|nr:hypothetical protein [Opitutaceae bacterium]
MKRWARPLPLLPKTRREMELFTEHNPQWKPILQLYEQLCEACGTELYGSKVMGGGLVLAARPDVAFDEGVILVYFDPKKNRFSLYYRQRDVQPEQSEECSEEDVWERLRLFLGYKFGVRVKKKKSV